MMDAIRPIVFLILLAAGTALPWSSPLAAEQTPAQKLVDLTERVAPYNRNEPAPFDEYPAAPAQQALSGAELARYHQALDKQDCKAAHSLVLEAFLARYPQIADAFRKPGVTQSWDVWVVLNVYPELFFCTARLEFETTQAELERKGTKPAPYRGWQHTANSDAAELRLRNYALFDIESLAERDYVPAIAFYLTLQSRPEVLRLRALDEALYLHRLHAFGAAAPDHDRRLKRAENALGEFQSEIARCAAERGPIGEPRHFDICIEIARRTRN